MDKEENYWERYAREIELEKKVAELGGIEKVESGEVKVPENIAKEMGIQPTVTADTPIKNVVSDFTVRGVALSDDQLAVGKTKPMSKGFRWLVEWFICQLLKAHFVIKKVGDKIFRIAPKQTNNPTGDSNTSPATPPPLPAAPPAGTPPGQNEPAPLAE